MVVLLIDLFGVVMLLLVVTAVVSTNGEVVVVVVIGLVAVGVATIALFL